MQRQLEDIDISTATNRMLYNYRSGKWDLPSSLIPILCKRFKSSALVNALTDQVNIPIETPPQLGFEQACTETLREVCDHHFNMITAYKSEAGLTPNDLNPIEAQLEVLIQRQRLLFTLLEAKREQQVNLRRKQA